MGNVFSLDYPCLTRHRHRVINLQPARVSGGWQEQKDHCQFAYPEDRSSMCFLTASCKGNKEFSLTLARWKHWCLPCDPALPLSLLRMTMARTVVAQLLSRPVRRVSIVRSLRHGIVPKSLNASRLPSRLQRPYARVDYGTSKRIDMQCALESAQPHPGRFGSRCYAVKDKKRCCFQCCELVVKGLSQPDM